MQPQRIFIAGATGVLGRRLVPLLVEKGYHVICMTRTPFKRAMLEQLRATPSVADALDATAVVRAIIEAEPDVAVHQLTDLSYPVSMRNLENTFARNARLRSEGTDNLLSAGRAAGVRRFVAQCWAGFVFVDGPPRQRVSEDEPLGAVPHPTFRRALAADRHLEHVVTG